MTRWGTVFSRLRNPGGDVTGRAAGGEGPADEPPVLVDQRHGLLLIRCSAQAAPGPEDVAGLARSLAATGDGASTATVVIGADGEVPAALWRRLAGTLDTLRAQGAATVRLVLSGAGSGTPEQPALAQQIADSWQLRVIAPDGPAVIVPGGSLFAPHHPAAPRGWRLFTPGGDPEPCGHRHPAPAWQEAIGRLPGTTATGCVVEQIPAGVLVRSPRARPPRPGDLCYAAPVDPSHPLIVVGVPGPADTADIPSDDLSALLAALPAAIRAKVRLAPGDHKDLLPAAQDVADSLGIEVELLTGLPLIDDGPPEDTGPARPALIGRDAGLTWRPFVEAVVCRPAADDTQPPPEPRLLRWRPPVPAFGDGRRRTVPLAVPLAIALTIALAHAPPHVTLPFAVPNQAPDAAPVHVAHAADHALALPLTLSVAVQVSIQAHDEEPVEVAGSRAVALPHEAPVALAVQDAVARAVTSAVEESHQVTVARTVQDALESALKGAFKGAFQGTVAHAEPRALESSQHEPTLGLAHDVQTVSRPVSCAIALPKPRSKPRAVAGAVQSALPDSLESAKPRPEPSPYDILPKRRAHVH